jgi:hypothetical protein
MNNETDMFYLVYRSTSYVELTNSLARSDPLFMLSPNLIATHFSNAHCPVPRLSVYIVCLAQISYPLTLPT